MGDMVLVGIHWDMADPDNTLDSLLDIQLGMVHLDSK